jgi:hypothetical protein
VATLCDFTLVVSGPASELRQFREAVEENAEEVTGEGSSTGYFVVSLDPEKWGTFEGYDFFWTSPRRQGRDAGFDTDGTGPTYYRDGNLVIDGTSKWVAPSEFIERASAVFPTLTFRLRGWTQDGFYERWTARGGLARLAEEKRVGAGGEVIRWVLDGTVVMGEGAVCWSDSARVSAWRTNSRFTLS